MTKHITQSQPSHAPRTSKNLLFMIILRTYVEYKEYDMSMPHAILACLFTDTQLFSN